MTFNLACRGTGLRPANYEKMLANGFGRAYNLARQGRLSCWLPNESGGITDPICECASFPREGWYAFSSERVQ